MTQDELSFIKGAWGYYETMPLYEGDRVLAMNMVIVVNYARELIPTLLKEIDRRNHADREESKATCRS